MPAVAIASALENRPGASTAVDVPKAEARKLSFYYGAFRALSELSETLDQLFEGKIKPPNVALVPVDFRSTQFDDLARLLDAWKPQLEPIEKLKHNELADAKKQHKKNDNPQTKQKLEKAKTDNATVEHVRQIVDDSSTWLDEITALRDELKKAFVIHYELKVEAKSDTAATVTLVKTGPAQDKP